MDEYNFSFTLEELDSGIESDPVTDKSGGQLDEWIASHILQESDPVEFFNRAKKRSTEVNGAFGETQWHAKLFILPITAEHLAVKKLTESKIWQDLAVCMVNTINQPNNNVVLFNQPISPATAAFLTAGELSSITNALKEFAVENKQPENFDTLLEKNTEYRSNLHFFIGIRAWIGLENKGEELLGDEKNSLSTWLTESEKILGKHCIPGVPMYWNNALMWSAVDYLNRSLADFTGYALLKETHIARSGDEYWISRTFSDKTLGPVSIPAVMVVSDLELFIDAIARNSQVLIHNHPRFLPGFDFSPDLEINYSNDSKPDPVEAVVVNDYRPGLHLRPNLKRKEEKR